MKKVFILKHVNILSTCLILGLLLMAVNLYAAGDLIVEGSAGIGTTTPGAKLQIDAGTAADKGLIVKGYASQSGNLQEWQNSAGTVLSVIGKNGFFGGGGSVSNPIVPIHINRGNFTALTITDFGQSASLLSKRTTASLVNIQAFAEMANTASQNTLTAGLNASAYHTGTANLTYDTIGGLVGGRYSARVQSNSPVVITRAVGVSSYVELMTGYTATIARAIAFQVEPIDAEDGTITNAYGLYGRAHIKDTGTLTNAYSAWFEKQTNGVNNYGIVLNGDGAGADIVFGPNQEARIYSNAGELFAKDGTGNVTQISPHDPETGEWIFYSKNVKTGKVVRVDMERLVKAVEKLTGEKFMIEAME